MDNNERTQMAFRLTNEKKKNLKIAMAVNDVSLQCLCESVVDMLIGFNGLKGAEKKVMTAIIKKSKSKNE